MITFKLLFIYKSLTRSINILYSKKINVYCILDKKLE